MRTKPDKPTSLPPPSKPASWRCCKRPPSFRRPRRSAWMKGACAVGLRIPFSRRRWRRRGVNCSHRPSAGCITFARREQTPWRVLPRRRQRRRENGIRKPTAQAPFIHADRRGRRNDGGRLQQRHDAGLLGGGKLVGLSGFVRICPVFVGHAISSLPFAGPHLPFSRVSVVTPPLVCPEASNATGCVCGGITSPGSGSTDGQRTDKPYCLPMFLRNRRIRIGSGSLWPSACLSSNTQAGDARIIGRGVSVGRDGFGVRGILILLTFQFRLKLPCVPTSLAQKECGSHVRHRGLSLSLSLPHYGTENATLPILPCVPLYFSWGACWHARGTHGGTHSCWIIPGPRNAPDIAAAEGRPPPQHAEFAGGSLRRPPGDSGGARVPLQVIHRMLLLIRQFRRQPFPRRVPLIPGAAWAVTAGLALGGESIIRVHGYRVALPADRAYRIAGDAHCQAVAFAGQVVFAGEE